MRYQLNTQALAHFIRTKRAGWPLRKVAQAIGDISPATLSRVENEKAPDLLVFLHLCNWLAVPPEQFLEGVVEDQHAAVPPTADEPLPTITYLLRSDPQLDPTTANVLATVIEATYQALRLPPV